MSAKKQLILGALLAVGLMNSAAALAERIQFQASGIMDWQEAGGLDDLMGKPFTMTLVYETDTPGVLQPSPFDTVYLFEGAVENVRFQVGDKVWDSYSLACGNARIGDQIGAPTQYDYITLGGPIWGPGYPDDGFHGPMVPEFAAVSIVMPEDTFSGQPTLPEQVDESFLLGLRAAQISFNYHNYSFGAGGPIDEVSFSAAVPEPAEWLFMGIGLGLTGLLLKMKRQA